MFRHYQPKKAGSVSLSVARQTTQTVIWRGPAEIENKKENYMVILAPPDAEGERVGAENVTHPSLFVCGKSPRCVRYTEKMSLKIEQS